MRENTLPSKRVVARAGDGARAPRGASSSQPFARSLPSASAVVHRLPVRALVTPWWTCSVLLLCILAIGCRRGMVVPVSAAELSRVAAGSGSDVRARRSVTALDGRTSEIVGRIDVELRPHGGPRRVYRHPVVVTREGADLIVQGSNRPPARVRAEDLAAVVLHVQQAAPEPWSSEADEALALLECARSDAEVDPLGRGMVAVRGCGRAVVVRCVSPRPATGDMRLQLQTGIECGIMERASWRAVVLPWRALDDLGADEAPSAPQAEPSSEPGPAEPM